MWWLADNNARYGDIAAYRDERSDWIYILGGPPTTADNYLTQNYVYQARVNFREAFDLSKYEYWHGREAGWSSTRLTDFNSETAVMWNVGQGQIVWSEYLQCYIFVHTGKQATHKPLRTILNFSPQNRAATESFSGQHHHQKVHGLRT